MAWWMKNNIEPVEEVVEEKEVERTYMGCDLAVYEEKTTRVKEVVDLALALYLVGCESDYLEMEEYICAEYDRKHGIVFFNLLTEDIQDMVEYVRNKKMSNEPVAVDDYYKVSHMIGKLRRMISVNKKKILIKG